jgi:hypothetical protein
MTHRERWTSTAMAVVLFLVALLVSFDFLTPWIREKLDMCCSGSIGDVGDPTTGLGLVQLMTWFLVPLIPPWASVSAFAAYMVRVWHPHSNK